MSVDLVIDVLSWILIVAGSVFLIIGGIGLVRMPDVFTRMHATSVSDTAGAGFLLIAMMLQAGFSLVSAKLLFILVIFFFTGPVATHALSRAALSVGLEPLCFDRSGRKRRDMPLELADADGVPREQRSSGFAAMGDDLVMAGPADEPSSVVPRKKAADKAGTATKAKAGTATKPKAAAVKKTKDGNAPKSGTPRSGGRAGKAPAKPKGGGSSKR